MFPTRERAPSSERSWSGCEPNGLAVVWCVGRILRLASITHLGYSVGWQPVPLTVGVTFRTRLRRRRDERVTAPVVTERTLLGERYPGLKAATMNFEELSKLAEGGIQSRHEKSQGWREVHSLLLKGDKATLTRAWDIDDGDMNGEEGKCVAEVERSAVEAALERAARDGSVDETLPSRNQWSRVARYSESPSTPQEQSSDAHDGNVRLQLVAKADHAIDLTVLPTGTGEGTPWWLTGVPSDELARGRPS